MEKMAGDNVSREADLEKQIALLKSSEMQLELKYKNERFGKELLQKEIDKKKFRDKLQEGDLKMELKFLSLQYNKEKQENQSLKSKLFDSQEEIKRHLKTISDLKDKTKDIEANKMNMFYKNIGAVQNLYENLKNV